METPLNKIFRRFYSPKYMLKGDLASGELPPTRDIYKTVLVIALPALVELLFTSLISFIDVFMVSSLGDGAIAAVGITTQPRMILLSLFSALSIGVTAIVARSKGEGRPDLANQCLRQALVIVALLSVIVTAIGVVFSSPLLNFVGAQEDILAEAIDYFNITTYGLFFQAMTMTINAAQRGAGQTKITLVTNTVSNVVNIIFDYLLIEGHFGFPRLEVAGAGIATSMGFVASFIVAVITLFNKNSFIRVERKQSWAPNLDMIKRIARIGSNAAIEQVALRFGFLAFAMIIASLGTVVFATHQICMQLLSLSFTIGEAFSIAATSLCGQSLGEKRPHMAIVYGKSAQRVANSFSVVIFFFFFFAGTSFLMLFSDSPEVLELGVTIMRIAAFIQFFQISQVVIIGCLRGGGDNLFTALLSFVGVALMRPILSYSMVNFFGLGLVGAWFSIMADQILRSVATTVRFSSGKWMKKKV